jgi:hypothetical protein
MRRSLGRGIFALVGVTVAAVNCAAPIQESSTDPNDLKTTEQAIGGSTTYLYQHCNYDGYRVGLGPGDYNMFDLQARGVTNDDLSSLQVPDGYQATLYQDWNFTGYSVTLSGDTSCLVNVGSGRNDGRNWNDDISSLRIRSVGPSWHTDWEDQFNGSWLDRGKWTVVVGRDGDFNGEAQWYVDEEGVENNFWVSNGELKIKIQREDRNFGYWKNYTSARLTTKGKYTPSNGAWEARMIFWAGGGADGVWPAFWLLGSNVNENPYAGSACWPTWSAREIDIFEYTMDEGKLWPGNIITNFIQGNGCKQPSDSRGDIGVNVWDWHTYRMEFWGGEAKIFIDGQFKRSVNDDPWQDQGYAAILNVAIGGGLGGWVNFPSGAWAGISVDYVRHQYWY